MKGRASCVQNSVEWSSGLALYRQAAASKGNLQLAAFLAELEPLLIELAYEAHKTSPATRDRMQQEVRDSVLFRVRIMNQQLSNSNVST